MIKCGNKGTEIDISIFLTAMSNPFLSKLQAVLKILDDTQLQKNVSYCGNLSTAVETAAVSNRLG